MADKYFIKWKLFHENISESLRELRTDKDFTDVTLAFDDETMLDVNSVVLAACSPVLKCVIKKSKQPHIFIYLSGIRSSIFSSMIDFMYDGEVSVPQEDVDAFLALANQMKVKGLTQGNENIEEARNEFHKLTNTEVVEAKPMVSENIDLPQKLFKEDVEQIVIVDNALAQDKASEFTFNTDSFGTQYHCSQIEDNSECHVCGKVLYSQSKLAMHMNRYHEQEGVFHPCKFCEKSFRTQNARNVHKFRNHK